MFRVLRREVQRPSRNCVCYLGTPDVVYKAYQRDLKRNGKIKLALPLRVTLISELALLKTILSRPEMLMQDSKQILDGEAPALLCLALAFAEHPSCLL